MSPLQMEEDGNAADWTDGGKKRIDDSIDARSMWLGRLPLFMPTTLRKVYKKQGG